MKANSIHINASLEPKLEKYKLPLLQTLLFLLSILPMFQTQYGGCRGVQEISGFINLFNPFGILATCFFFIGTWYPFKRKSWNTLLGGIGMLGIVFSEIYTFLTWNMFQYSPTVIDLSRSFRFAFPEFYVGLYVSVLMTIIYFSLDRNEV